MRVIRGHGGGSLPQIDFHAAWTKVLEYKKNSLGLDISQKNGSDILPTKHCSTDTAGGRQEELFSPSLSHILRFLLKSWTALPTVNSHYGGGGLNC